MEVEGKIFPSLKRASEEYDLDYKTVFARKELGWTIKQMFNLDPPPNDKQMIKAVIIGDLKFESQAAFARHLGVSPALITKLKSSLSLDQIYEKYNKKPWSVRQLVYIYRYTTHAPAAHLPAGSQSHKTYDIYDLAKTVLTH